MKGIAYGVGVGSGDPELMTLKAIRIIRENSVIAVPGKSVQESVAYGIAVQNIPELAEKELIAINMPMVRDKTVLEQEHRKGAQIIEEYLGRGQNVVYLTLGDPTVYCSFSYLQRILESDGYCVELVSGISSVCAAAASLGIPLVEGDESLHILPASRVTENSLTDDGNYVIMKSGKSMGKIKNILKNSNLGASAVENCSMTTEKIYRSLDEIPDDAGYFSLIIAK